MMVDVFDGIEPDTYRVGPGNPPREYQFKKGQSGNPKGRPRGNASFADRARDFFNAKIAVTRRGTTVKSSRFEVMLNGLAIAASAGNASAFRAALSFFQQADINQEVSRRDYDETHRLAEAVRFKIEQTAQRLREAEGLPPDYTGPISEGVSDLRKKTERGKNDGGETAVKTGGASNG